MLYIFIHDLWSIAVWLWYKNEECKRSKHEKSRWDQIKTSIQFIQQNYIEHTTRKRRYMILQKWYPRDVYKIYYF